MVENGTRVLAQWTDGQFYRATVENAGTEELAVLFDDGVRGTVRPDQAVPFESPPLEGPAVGERIQGVWTNGHPYPGEVIERCGELVRIRWDDGVQAWIGPERVGTEANPPATAPAAVAPPTAEPRGEAHVFTPSPGVPFAVDDDVRQVLWRIHQFRVPEAERPRALPAQGLVEEQIAGLEQTLDLPFPNDLRTLLRYWPAGTAVGQGYFLSPERIVSQRGFFAEDHETFKYEKVSEDTAMRMTSTGWIPFAFDFGGGNLSVDLDPGPAGHVGQIVQNYPGDRRPIADSIAALLGELADGLEAGTVDTEMAFPEDAYPVWAGGGLPAEAEVEHGAIEIREAPAAVVERMDAAMKKLRDAVETFGGQDKLWLETKDVGDAGFDTSKLVHSPSPSYASFVKKHGRICLRVGADGLDEMRWTSGGRTHVFAILEVNDPVGAYYITADFQETNGLPTHFIVFHDGWWGPGGYALDASKPDADHEYPVVVFRPAALEDGTFPPAPVHASFADWLEAEVERIVAVITSHFG